MSRDDYLKNDRRMQKLQAGGFQKNKMTDPAAARKDTATDENGKTKSKIDTKVKKDQALNLRFRIPSKLKKLGNQCKKRLSRHIGQQISAVESDRAEYIDRLQVFRKSWEDYISTGLKMGASWQHDVHVPVIATDIKAMHARLFQAVMGIQPPFSLKPLKAVSEKAKQDKEDILAWTIREYANKGDGWENEIDLDLMNFVADGVAVTKQWWARDVRKFQDVREVNQRVEDGKLVGDEEEYERQEIVYDGPMMTAIPIEDVKIIGQKVQDIDEADMVIHDQFYTKSDVVKLSHQGFFEPDAVDMVIRREPTLSGDRTNDSRDIKEQQDLIDGIDTQDPLSGKPGYRVQECYLRYDIDDDGIDEELVVWREEVSGTIMRITYLERVSPTGKRPFVLKKFIPVKGTWKGVGLAEMLYGINNLIDYMTNQRLDAASLQILPIFKHRASSGINPQEMRFAPGSSLPVDDINDIAPLQVGGNLASGYKEEEIANQYKAKLSGITDLAFGSMQSQGATRTATGTAALVSELNANLDIFIKRYQRGYRKNLKILDRQVTELLPLGTIVRVQGVDDGKVTFKEFNDREVLRFDTDFDLQANSVNSNKALERETSQLLLQTLSNPLFLQTGIVTPENLYKITRNMLRKFDVQDIDSFIQKPEGMSDSLYSAKDEINMIMAGVKPPIMLNDKHAQKVEMFNAFEESDEFGYLTDEHIPLYLEVKQAHEQYASAVAAQAQLAGQSGNSVNPQLAAQIAAGSGNPGGGVPNQLEDLASAGLTDGPQMQ